MSFAIGQQVIHRGLTSTVAGYNTGGRVVLVRGVVDDPHQLDGWRLYGPWYNTPPTRAYSIDEAELEKQQ
jgi:hypothetical protein